MNTPIRYSLKRALSLVLCAVMLLGLFPASALALDDWQSLSVTLAWVDAAGTPMQVQAMPVPWSQNQAFWAQVPADVPLDTLTVTPMHPNHAYTFQLGDDFGTVTWQDAGTELLEDAGIMIRAYENDMLVDTYQLYVSTLIAMPEEPPVVPLTATVEVTWLSDDGMVNESSFETVTQGMPLTFAPREYPGYVCLNPDPVTVDVGPDGMPTQGRVEFRYQKEAAPNAEVAVRHVAQDGTVLFETVDSLAPGTQQTYGKMDFAGYTCLDETPITVTVDANGVADRASVEFYYQVFIPNAEVAIRHIAQDGTVLSETVDSLAPGTQQTYNKQDFAGYTCLEETPITVTVDANGTPDRASVEFYYQVFIPNAEVAIRHIAQDGTVLSETVDSLAPGTQQTYNKQDFAGYTCLDETPITVTVDANGVADRASVEFYYQVFIPNAEVAIRHIAQDGTVLSETVESLTPNTQQTYTKQDFAGYTCLDETPITVTVDANGTPDRATVEFTYARLISVTVKHMDRSGTELFTDTLELIAGTESPCYPREIEGYTPESSAPLTISVSPEGIITPDPAIIYYTRNQVTVDVTVTHLNTKGEVLAEETATMTEGETKVFLPQAIDGYEPENPDGQTISIGEGGAISGDTVLRYLRKAEVTVQHVADDGTTLSSETATVVEGRPATFAATSFAGYTFAAQEAESIEVSVDADGVLSQNPVIFHYAYVPKNATVQVLHVTTQNATLAEETVTLTEGEERTIAPQAIPGYVPATPDGVTVTVDATGTPSQNPVLLTYLRTADMTVRHMSGDQLLMEEPVTVTENQPLAVHPREMTGYTPVSAEGITVTVDANGTITPDPAVISYQRDLYTATVVVRHVNTRQEELYAEEIPVTEGTPLSLLPRILDGYVAASEEPVTVQVGSDGVAQPESVTFTYLRVANATVLHLDEAGQELFREQTSLVEGEPKTIVPQAIENYVPVQSEGVTITLDVDGQTTPAQPAIYYQRLQTEAPTLEPTAEPTAEPTVEPTAEPTAEPTVEPTAEPTAEPTVEPTAEPTTEPTAEPTIEPTVEPTVEPTAEPTAEPTVAPTDIPTATPTATPTVAPTDTPAPQPTEYVPAMVIVRYVDKNTGADLIERQYVTLVEGRSMIIADESVLPDGWALSGEDRVTVDVQSGVPSRDEIIFTCEAEVAPTDIPTASPTPAPEWGTVIVHYESTKGSVIAPDQALTLHANQTHRIEPDLSLIPADYDLDGVPAQDVTIGQDGKATPEEITFAFDLKIIPVGELINRFGMTNTGKLNMRKEPTKSSKAVMSNIRSGRAVWLIEEVINEANESWYHVLYNGKEGYISAEFVDMLSVAESNEQQQKLLDAGSTAVPGYVPPTPNPTDAPTLAPTDAPTTAPTDAPTETPTLAPTDAPTSAPTDAPTETPTLAPTTEPTQAPTDVPTSTPEPAQYAGYALTKEIVALRDGISTEDSSLILRMEQDTLLDVEGQLYTASGEAWSKVTTLDNVSGYVPDSSLRRINEQEAKYYLDLWAQAHPAPTEQPTPAVTPAQVEGWFYTVGDNVPLRNVPSDRSVLLAELPRLTPVYVASQLYETEDGWPWHLVQYGGQWGYIRSDMLRMMTEEEMNEYLSGPATSAPTPITTPAPYDSNSLSSYGYIYAANSGRVNLRQNPSTQAQVVKELRNYAFCLITGTEVVNGTTWYRIEFGGQRGYVRGDLLKQMTLAELEDFLDSDLYQQGIRNNTAASATATTGPFVSQEQQNANIWTNPNSGLNITYATWAPMRTVAPLPTEAATTYEPLPTPEPISSQTPAPSQSPEALATVDMTGGDNTQSGGGGLGWIILVIVLLLLGGAAYVVIMQRENRRKAAQRAAQRRAAQAAQQRTAAGQPRTGAYPPQNGKPVQPGATPTTGAAKPGTTPMTSAGKPGTTPMTGASKPGTTPMTGAAKPMPSAKPVQPTPQRPAAPAPAAPSKPDASAYQRPVDKSAEAVTKPADTPASSGGTVPHRQRRTDRVQHQDDNNQQPPVNT